MKVKVLAKEWQAAWAAIGGRPEPADLKARIGIAFERECRERLANRFKGPIDEKEVFRVIRELRIWGQALATAVAAEPIPEYVFDHVSGSVIAEHNRKAPASRFVAAKPVEEEPVGKPYVPHKTRITLGDMLAER